MDYPDKLRREAVQAIRVFGCLAPVSKAYLVSTKTLKKWAREQGVRIPSARKRMSIGARHCAEGRRSRWPSVVELHLQGVSNIEIAHRLGYKSQASITHVLKQV